MSNTLSEQMKDKIALMRTAAWACYCDRNNQNPLDMFYKNEYECAADGHTREFYYALKGTRGQDSCEAGNGEALETEVREHEDLYKELYIYENGQSNGTRWIFDDDGEELGFIPSELENIPVCDLKPHMAHFYDLGRFCNMALFKVSLE